MIKRYEEMVGKVYIVKEEWRLGKNKNKKLDKIFLIQLQRSPLGLRFVFINLRNKKTCTSCCDFLCRKIYL